MLFAAVLIALTVTVAAVSHRGHAQINDLKNGDQMLWDRIDAELDQVDDPPESWVDTVTRKRVLIHTTDGSSFDGLLAVVADNDLVLADATSLDGDEPQPLAGEQWFARDRIKFVQVIS